MNKHDISTEADIKLLIDSFYKKVIADPTIGFIFTNIVALSWEKHIPIMNSFWGSVLLGKNTYSGNPMIKHIELDKKIMLKKEHFDKWLLLWEDTVHENFSGENAREAISRAKNIASLMQFKIEQNQVTNNKA
ncbi:MAG: group III truncated hemoglobin [Bacteroidetes bacterium]|nr:group III truncated hemoglobin [Bacteroidota bacterium]